MKSQLHGRSHSKKKRMNLSPILLALLVFAMSAHAQTGSFTPLTTKAPHNNGGVILLLPDGRVMCKTASGGDQYGNLWDILTPDIHGSYANGTFTTSAPMVSTRLYFSSDILKDGKVYVGGGE